MTPIGAVVLTIVAAAAVACGEHTGGEGNANSGASAGAGSPITQASRTTVTGCVQADERSGGFVLRTTDRSADAPSPGTGGRLPERSSSEGGLRTTGRGSDIIANSPTIGSHESTGRVFLIVPENGTADVSQYRGKRVTAGGVLQGGRVFHAQSFTVVAGDCSAPASNR